MRANGRGNGLRAGNREYAYDNRGNLIEESLGGVKAEFAYDGEDRLVDAFTKVEGFLGRGRGSDWSLKAGVRYEYDALGRRVSRAEYDLVERGRKQERNWDLSSAEEYLYEGQSMDVLAEYRDWDYRPATIGAPHLPWFEGGSRPKWGARKEKPWNRRGWGGRPEEYRLEAEYVYAGGEILSRDEYDPAERWSRSRRDSEYYTQDLLGSVMMTTDAEGKVRERYEYDAFGQAYGGAIQRMNNLGYNGKRLDPRTGLYDYGFRDYAPKQGRFTTVDPIRDGENWYAYVGNDPVNYVDLLGLADIGATVPSTEPTYANSVAHALGYSDAGEVAAHMEPNANSDTTLINDALETPDISSVVGVVTGVFSGADQFGQNSISAAAGGLDIVITLGQLTDATVHKDVEAQWGVTGGYAGGAAMGYWGAGIGAAIAGPVGAVVGGAVLGIIGNALGTQFGTSAAALFVGTQLDNSEAEKVEGGCPGAGH